MNKILALIFFFFFLHISIFAQVKIGNNPSQINKNSLLELESSDKVLVLSRITSDQMNKINPLQGAMVYNIDEKCIFVFEGTKWKSLCNSGTVVTTSSTMPTANAVGDFWIDDTKSRNLVQIWDGRGWIPININPKSGEGAPTTATVQNSIAGDIYVDETTGNLYTYNGSSWLNNTSTNTSTVNNGISKNLSNVIQLGGTLLKATEITTNSVNTLAIRGLEDTNEADETDLVVVEKDTGILKKVTASSLLKEEVVLIIAQDNQIQFTTPLPITNSKKVNVYRNGVRIDFTVIDSTTIELEAEAVCYQNDEIRIVQFY